ncbi:conjugal transfer protein TraJ [Klebsiella aerogenes]|nr:conjugal transfer protein TraJ [Klebsiella aerogenes]
MLIEENVTINGKRWDFIVEKMSFKGNKFTLWKFCHIQRGGFLLSPARNNLISKINAFKNAVIILSDVQLETLSLYAFGASHTIISDVLNISAGTSKNRINRIYSTLPVKTKDEVFYLLYASGLAMSFFRVVGELMSKRVNRLLNK